MQHSQEFQSFQQSFIDDDYNGLSAINSVWTLPNDQMANHGNENNKKIQGSKHNIIDVPDLKNADIGNEGRLCSKDQKIKKSYNESKGNVVENVNYIEDDLFAQQESLSIVKEIVNQILVSVVKSNLSQGDTFENFSEFEKAFAEYLDANYTHVTIFKSDKSKKEELDKTLFPYLRVHYICVFGYDSNKVKEKPATKRPNQSTFAKNCSFELKVRLNRQNRYQITKFTENHCNHEVSKQVYESHPKGRRLTTEERDVFIGHYAKELNVSTSILKNEIKKETGKNVTTQDVVNMKYRYKPDMSDLAESIQILTEEFKANPGSSLRIIYNEKENEEKVVKVLFWQSKSMKILYQQFGSIIHMDGTYRLTDRQYVLITLSVIDNHKSTRLVGWAFVSSEHKQTLEAALQAFASENGTFIENTKFVIIDKDFSEIGALHSVLPNVTFIICKFHAIKAVKFKCNQLKLSSQNQHLKQVLYIGFLQMLHAPTEEEYNAEWDKLIRLSQNCQEIVQGISYLEKNWHLQREHWAFYILKQYPLFDSFTNNRAEAINKHLKANIKKNTKFPLVISSLFRFSNDQIASVKMKDFEMKNKTFMPKDVESNAMNELILIGSKFLSKSILGSLRIQLREAENVKDEEVCLDKNQLSCTRTNGKCKFFNTNNLPCRHLFYTRQKNDEIILTPDMIGQHWKKQYKDEDNTPQKNPAFAKMPPKQNTQTKRFNEAAKVCRNLAQAVSLCPEEEKQHNLEVLNQIADAINKKTTISFDDKYVYGFKSPSKSQSDFVFSPKRKTNLKSEGHTNIKRFKKDNEKGRNEFKNETDLSEWQSNINKTLSNMNLPTLSASEFQDLRSKSFLNDNHMLLAQKMLKHQFPLIEGLNSTLLYKSTGGFPPVTDKKDFIQICHCGSDHWIVLTNIGLPTEQRLNEIRVFDSFITLSSKQKHSCYVKPAIEWQAAMLLKTEKNEKNGIILNVQPCAQQSNGYDCGLYSVSNAISLAMGKNPNDLYYTGDMRLQFLNMLREGKLKMFQNTDKTLSNIYAFKQTSNCNGFSESIELKEMKIFVEIVCDCKMPLSYGDIIECDTCNLTFHQKCYLLGSGLKSQTGIAQQLRVFKCYNCRGKELIDYSFLESNTIEGKENDIERFCKNIYNMSQFKLNIFVPQVLSLQADFLFSKMEDYQRLEHIWSKFDLNRLCIESGPIYKVVYEFYCNSDSTMSKKHPFPTLNKAQKIHLILLFICEVLNLECPPIYTKISHNENQGKLYKLGDLLKQNKDWLKQLQTYAKKLASAVDTVSIKYINRNIKSDEVDNLRTEICSLKEYTTDLLASYESTSSQNATSSDIKMKENICINLNDMLEKCEGWMETLDLWLTD